MSKDALTSKDVAAELHAKIDYWHDWNVPRARYPDGTYVVTEGAGDCSARELARLARAEIARLERELAESKEAHAQLQSRCFDGGGSQSVFDAVTEGRERIRALEETGGLLRMWLVSCLNCKTYNWDHDQRTAAAECVAGFDALQPQKTVAPHAQDDDDLPWPLSEGRDYTEREEQFMAYAVREINPQRRANGFDGLTAEECCRYLQMVDAFMTKWRANTLHPETGAFHE